MRVTSGSRNILAMRLTLNGVGESDLFWYNLFYRDMSRSVNG